MSDSVIEEIKSRLDIVDIVKEYVKLEKVGANYRGLCPFHLEKTPSFFVSPSRQIWHCFGACGEGGDIFKFIMKIEGVEFSEALRILARKAGVELKKENSKIRTEKERLAEVLEISCQFFETQLKKSRKGEEAIKYLFKRGVKEETINKWRLGYAPESWQGLSDFLVGRGYKREEIGKAGLSIKSPKSGKYYDRFRGRIIFPIFNLNSQVVAFGGRIFNNTSQENKEAKYINSPATVLYNKSKILYGLDKAKKAIREKDSCILVEGYMDAIMAHQAGVENAVATSGTALTEDHLRIIKRYSDNLFTAFDMDLAGGSATKRGIHMAQAMGFNIKVVLMPEGKDPADLVLTNPDKFKEAVEKAKSIHDFYFQDVVSGIDKNSLEGKKNISEIILPVIKRIPNKVEQAVWLKDLADFLEIREEALLEEMKKISLEDSQINRAEIDNLERKGEKSRKTRKEGLEEYLIILILKKPELIDRIKENNYRFFSKKTIEILNFIKEKGSESLTKRIVYSEKEEESEKKEGGYLNNGLLELNDKMTYLLLKADIEDIEEKKIEEELENCLREIKKIFVKERIENLSRSIKEAEKNGETEKTAALLKELAGITKEENL